MRNLIAVAFVEPVAEGLEFPRDDWPLHLTLVKFDVVTAGVVKSDVVEPGQETRHRNPRRARRRPRAIRSPTTSPPSWRSPVAAALGCRLSVGGEAGFGRAGSIPVNLIEPSEELQVLHNELVRIVDQLPGRISTPAYTLEGYRPHVSHHGDKRLRQGDTFALDRIALVDMAPDGGHATRRILKLWTDGQA